MFRVTSLTVVDTFLHGFFGMALAVSGWKKEDSLKIKGDLDLVRVSIFQ